MRPRLSDFSKLEQTLLIEAASAVIPDGGPLDDNWPDCQNDVASTICEVMPDLEIADTYDLENDLISAVVRGVKE